MTLPRLESLSHSELIEKIKSIRSTERLASAEVVLYLFEIDTRGIFRDYGYSSLFTFCTAALGFSEGSAWRRVAAARCLKEHPEVDGTEGKKNIEILFKAVESSGLARPC